MQQEEFLAWAWMWPHNMQGQHAADGQLLSLAWLQEPACFFIII
jgi:hypothetical protein